jgi:hypothetical protein
MSATPNTRELLGLERRFWGAMLAKDGRRAADMTDEECVVVGAQGVSKINPDTMKKLTQEGNWELKDFTIDDNDAQVLMMGDDIALVAYKVKERLMVEGTPVTLQANDASVWIRRDGKWLCAMHTESLAGDPFGRDKH